MVANRPYRGPERRSGRGRRTGVDDRRRFRTTMPYEGHDSFYGRRGSALRFLGERDILRLKQEGIPITEWMNQLKNKHSKVYDAQWKRNRSAQEFFTHKGRRYVLRLYAHQPGASLGMILPTPRREATLFNIASTRRIEIEERRSGADRRKKQ